MRTDGIAATSGSQATRAPRRSLPRDADTHENYADWSDEQRAARRAVNDRQREEYERERKTKLDARHELVRSAKKKLAKEEFDAVGCWAADECDEWDPEDD